MIACPKGIIGAPKRPCPMRNKIKLSKFNAKPQNNEARVKPKMVPNINLRHPNRPASHPVRGVATAAATRFNVIAQDTSSWLADIAPRIWGRTTFAIVIVIPKSMFDNWTIRRISQSFPLILKIPGSGSFDTSAFQSSNSHLYFNLEKKYTDPSDKRDTVKREYF